MESGGGFEFSQSGDDGFFDSFSSPSNDNNSNISDGNGGNDNSNVIGGSIDSNSERDNINNITQPSSSSPPLQQQQQEKEKEMELNENINNDQNSIASSNSDIPIEASTDSTWTKDTFVTPPEQLPVQVEQQQHQQSNQSILDMSKQQLQEQPKQPEQLEQIEQQPVSIEPERQSESIQFNDDSVTSQNLESSDQSIQSNLQNQQEQVKPIPEENQQQQQQQQHVSSFFTNDNNQDDSSMFFNSVSNQDKNETSQPSNNQDQIPLPPPTDQVNNQPESNIQPVQQQKEEPKQEEKDISSFFGGGSDSNSSNGSNNNQDISSFFGGGGSSSSSSNNQGFFAQDDPNSLFFENLSLQQEREQEAQRQKEIELQKQKELEIQRQKEWEQYQLQQQQYQQTQNNWNQQYNNYYNNGSSWSQQGQYQQQQQYNNWNQQYQYQQQQNYNNNYYGQNNSGWSNQYQPNQQNNSYQAGQTTSYHNPSSSSSPVASVQANPTNYQNSSSPQQTTFNVASPVASVQPPHPTAYQNVQQSTYQTSHPTPIPSTTLLEQNKQQQSYSPYASVSSNGNGSIQNNYNNYNTSSSIGNNSTLSTSSPSIITTMPTTTNIGFNVTAPQNNNNNNNNNNNSSFVSTSSVNNNQSSVTNSSSVGISTPMKENTQPVPPIASSLITNHHQRNNSYDQFSKMLNNQLNTNVNNATTNILPNNNMNGMNMSSGSIPTSSNPQPPISHQNSFSTTTSIATTTTTTNPSPSSSYQQQPPLSHQYTTTTPVSPYNNSPSSSYQQPNTFNSQYSPQNNNISSPMGYYNNNNNTNQTAPRNNSVPDFRYANSISSSSSYQGQQQQNSYLQPNSMVIDNNFGNQHHHHQRSTSWNGSDANQKGIPLYSCPHPVFSFGFGGKFVYLKKNSTQPPKVNAQNNQVLTTLSVGNIKSLVQNNQFFSNLTSFPGPLTSGSSKDQVTKWILDRIVDIGLGKLDDFSGGNDAEASIIIWEILRIMICNDGQIQESETKFIDPAIQSVLVDNKSKMTKFVPTTPPTNEQNLLHDLQRDLMRGDIRGAHKFAMDNQLWTHAIILSLTLGQETYSKTVLAFSTVHLPIGSPIKTAYSLYSQNMKELFNPQQPNPSFLENWRENISLILFSGGRNGQKIIGEIGDYIWSREKRVQAAHVCYLLAEYQFGPLSDPNSRIVLLGGDHKIAQKQFITIESLQRSEIYEYSKSLGNSQYSLPLILPFKFYYATLLADFGLIDKSLKYLHSIKNSFKNHQPNPTFMYLCDTFGERLESSLNKPTNSGWIPPWFKNPFKKSNTLPNMPSSPQPTPSTTITTSSPFQSISSSTSSIPFTPTTTTITTTTSNNIKPQKKEDNEEDPYSSFTTKSPINKPSNNYNGGVDLNDSVEKVKTDTTTGSGGKDMGDQQGTEKDKKSNGGFWSFFKKKGESNPKEMLLKDENTFVYNEELGTWVEKGKPLPQKEAPLPPPPMGGGMMADMNGSGMSMPPMSNSPSGTSSPPMMMAGPNSPNTGMSSSTDGAMKSYSMASPAGGKRRPRYLDTFNQTVHGGVSSSPVAGIVAPNSSSLSMSSSGLTTSMPTVAMPSAPMQDYDYQQQQQQQQTMNNNNSNNVPPPSSQPIPVGMPTTAMMPSAPMQEYDYQQQPPPY